ncbi:INO80 complex subunit B [Coemansia sp. RSA 2336]|nr:INO80 complex subunit B [Coemansia sp. RSA 2336]
MPPKRKINDDSTTPSDTASDASDTPSTRRTRRLASSDPRSSPAPNTRRSARLTRGLRRDSVTDAKPARGRGAGTRGGRGRGRPRGSGRGSGARRGAPAGRRGRGRPRANTSSVKSDSDDEPDDESDAIELLDKSDSDSNSDSLEEPADDPASSEGSPARSAELAEDDDMSGLSDVGELVTGPSANLTRRQRAKLNREQGAADLVELPLEAKRSRFSAEESALRKSEHARRRKFQSQQRAEQLKNDTINRLLNKQTSKGRNRVADDPDTRANSVEDSPGPALLRYSQRCVLPTHSEPAAHTRCALSLPKHVQIADLFPARGPVSYPGPAPPCAVAGCQLKKKYSAGAQPACSLEHWKVLKANAA